ncbi:MAG: hypothetical protein HY921_04665 [Elusimicrobia bacterium]|nr:hypothetical protein [Elusimicrobiota bacterium]
MAIRGHFQTPGLSVSVSSVLSRLAKFLAPDLEGREAEARGMLGVLEMALEQSGWSLNRFLSTRDPRARSLALAAASETALDLVKARFGAFESKVSQGKVPQAQWSSEAARVRDLVPIMAILEPNQKELDDFISRCEKITNKVAVPPAAAKKAEALAEAVKEDLLGSRVLVSAVAAAADPEEKETLEAQAEVLLQALSVEQEEDRREVLRELKEIALTRRDLRVMVLQGLTSYLHDQKSWSVANEDGSDSLEGLVLQAVAEIAQKSADSRERGLAMVLLMREANRRNHDSPGPILGAVNAIRQSAPKPPRLPGAPLPWERAIKEHKTGAFFSGSALAAGLFFVAQSVTSPIIFTPLIGLMLFVVALKGLKTDHPWAGFMHTAMLTGFWIHVSRTLMSDGFILLDHPVAFAAVIGWCFYIGLMALGIALWGLKALRSPWWGLLFNLAFLSWIFLL